MADVQLTRLRCFLVGCLALLLLVPMVAFTQGPGGPPGGPGGPGGFRGGRGGGGGSSRFFDFISQGKDSFSVDNLPAMFLNRDPQAKEKMQAFLEKKGVKNGQMTRDLFTEYLTEMRAQREGTPPGGPPGAAPAATPPASEADLEAQAREEFKRADRNNDGVLQPDEMPEALYRSRERWDANKNGTIDFNEFKEYHKAAAAERRPAPPVPATEGSTPPAEEEKRPVVYRAGNLPRELPPWFEQLDSDKDAQVGLYEWKTGGRPLNEFLAMDQNGDGLLTVEEVLRFQKGQKKESGGPVGPGGPGIVALSPGEAQATGGAPPAMGGWGRGGRGTGGWGRGSRGMGPGGPGDAGPGGGRFPRGNRGGN